jgi:hypothetical protein
MDLGFQAHLAKPVDVAMLLSTIRRLTAARATRAQTDPGSVPLPHEL